MSSGVAPFTVAVIGAGPSGIYAAEALSQQTDIDVQVAVLDRLPVPFGLVRYGVAPDHPSIRSIRNTLERTLEKPNVRFYGDVTIGSDLTIDELRSSVDAVIYAYGAGADRRLGIAGEDLPGSIAAPEFVAWYCGHPDVHPDTGPPEPGHEPPQPESGQNGAAPMTSTEQHAAELIATTQQAVVIGIGNVALDVARVLIKVPAELDDTDMADEVLAALGRKTVTDVHILGRRGPAYTAFTTKELRELGQLTGVDLIVRPEDLHLDESSSAVIGQDKVAARNLAVLTEWAGRTVTAAARRIHFHFWTRPVRILGTDRVEAVEVEGTRITADGYVEGTGQTCRIDAQLVVRSVGYRGVCLPGVPFDEGTGRVPHAEGRVIREGAFSADEYVTGWIKRGPTGVIGTNKSDAVETVVSLLTDISASAESSNGAVTARHGVDELDALLASRGVHPLGMPAWHRIDAAEADRGASHGRQRTTLAHRSELLAAAAESTG